MTIQVFEELYISVCENCGADLEGWDWFEDDMIFRTTCSCGCEYILAPSMGILTADADTIEDEDENDEE